MSQENKTLMVACIMEAFTCSETVSEVIMDIIHEEFDKIEKVIEEARERAQERIDEGNGIESGQDLEILTQEEIAAYLGDFALSEGRGHTGSMYELENGSEYMFGDTSDVEEEAKEDSEELFGEMIDCAISDLKQAYGSDRNSQIKWLMDNVIEPFRNGGTFEGVASSMASVDNLARYDGNYHQTGNYYWFRTN